MILVRTLIATAALSACAVFAATPGSPEIAAADSLCRARPARAAYSFQRPDGNRLAAGKGALPHAMPLDIDLSGVPRWLFAIAVGESASLWVAVLDSGRVEGYRLDARAVSRISVESRAAGSHGLQLTLDGNGQAAVVAGLVLNGAAAFVDSNAIHACRPSGPASLPVRPLPDGHLLAAGSGRLLLLTAPTDRYPHAIMGDALEASTITLIDAGPPLAITREIAIPAPRVIEGRGAIWADLDGSGANEIIVTESDPEGGARIVVYGPGGRRIGTSPPVGRGFRWRHQIAVAPFGPNGEVELAEVVTPHIGGVVQFLRWRGEHLETVARLPGYSSHRLGSPNLDMAAAGDFDGDGQVELLVPEQSYLRLAAIRRTAAGAAPAWTLELDAGLSTNIATATASSGVMAVGVGSENGTLRIWPYGLTKQP